MPDIRPPSFSPLSSRAAVLTDAALKAVSGDLRIKDEEPAAAAAEETPEESARDLSVQCPDYPNRPRGSGAYDISTKEANHDSHGSSSPRSYNGDRSSHHSNGSVSPDDVSSSSSNGYSPTPPDEKIGNSSPRQPWKKRCREIRVEEERIEAAAAAVAKVAKIDKGPSDVRSFGKDSGRGSDEEGSTSGDQADMESSQQNMVSGKKAVADV